MRRIVLDASALLTWFEGPATASPLRLEYEGGLLGVVAPPQLTTDLLGCLAASRDWPADRLVRVAAEIDRLGFEIRESPVDEIAAWLARGLPAVQAPYAALASALDLPLITADPGFLRRAGSIARSTTDG
ncbi:MAG: hypothetical protein ACT4OQ_10850 [Chloroflexota bacterium]